jgi:excisionase family DNA binding protein
MEVDMAESELLSVTDSAKILGCSSDLVRLLERTGKLPAMKTAGGVRIFRREDVEAMRRTRAQERRAR